MENYFKKVSKTGFIFLIFQHTIFVRLKAKSFRLFRWLLLYDDMMIKLIYISAVLQICICDTVCATRKILVRQRQPMTGWLVYSYFFNFRKFFDCMRHANLQLAAAVFGSF